MDSNQASQALKEAKALVAALESYDGSAEQHHALIHSAGGVRAAMEDPNDKTTRWVETMACAAALNFLICTGALEEMPAEGIVPISEVAAKCHVDQGIMKRAMRLLAVDGIFQETGTANEYVQNETSRAFHPSKSLGCYLSLVVDMMRSLILLPDYFATHQPADVYDEKKTLTAFQAGKEGLTYYEVLDTWPSKQRSMFNFAMQMDTEYFPVLGMFPFREYLNNLDDSEAQESQERPYIVDIGGGRGQVLLTIQKDCSKKFEGRLILQDVAVVIDTLKPEDIPGIKPMVHDAFTQQPIKDAYIYLMRRLLHDFPDAKAVEALRSTASAMAPDSRLIICEMLVPDRVQVGECMSTYWLDFFLLTAGGKERTMAEFEDLCNQAGLEIVKVHPSPDKATTAMIETRLKSK